MLAVYLSLIDDSKKQDKFEYIYIHFRKQMLHLANEIINNPYDSEDVVHNTFLSIAKNIHIFDNRSDKEIYTYLMCATRGHSYNFIRKKNYELQYINNEKVFYSDAVWNDLEKTVDFDFLVDTIKNLNPLYADVLYLYYVKELTYKEVARLLNRKPKTIRKQIERGKALLLAELKKRGYFDEQR